MSNLVVTGKELLHSGKYSDFTILCEGETIKAHKNIVCSQSPVFTAALNNGFQETVTSTIVVNFDLLTLRCMLDYIYTSDYPKELPAKNAVQSTPAKAGTQEEGTDITAEGEFNHFESYPFAETLLYHVRVNCIADYYQILSLITLTRKRVEHLLEMRWSAEAFYNTIQEAFYATGDKGLRQILVDTAAAHLGELERDNVFTREEGGLVEDELATAVFRASFGNLHFKTAHYGGLEREVAEGKLIMAGLAADVETATQRQNLFAAQLRYERDMAERLREDFYDAASSGVRMRPHFCVVLGNEITFEYSIREVMSRDGRWSIFCDLCHDRLEVDAFDDNNNAAHLW